MRLTDPRRTGAALASGVALALARPPFDLGAIAFVALVPLLWSWRGVRPRTAAKLGFVAGAAYNGIVVSWSWYFGAVAIVPFVAVLAAYWALVGATIAAFDRRGIRHPLVTAAIWVVGEGLLARWPFGGFSWGEVGYSAHALEPVRALGALGGLPLISFVIVAANAALLDLARARAGASRSAAFRATAVLLSLGVVVGAWAVVLPEPTRSGELRFALLQGNDINRDLTRAELDAGTLPENHFALAERLSGRFDLIVFPESTFLDAPNAPRPEYLGFRWPERLAALARKHDSYVLANGTGDAPDGRALNLDVLWDPSGTEVGTYAKRHRVPYGEWVPFRSFLERFIDEVDQIPRDFAPGSTRGEFVLDGTRIATVICFESMFGAEVRPLVARGAEVIVVSTNNRSYRHSANASQHLAAEQIRAVETGRPVLRASISGISAVIDADGTIVARQGLFDNGILQGTIVTRTGSTPYVRFGEWVLWGSGAALLAAGGLVAARAFARDRATFVDSANHG